MSKATSTLNRATDNALARVIEPLAGYICATDQPQAALRSALALLFSAVEETNRVAHTYVGNFSETQSS